MKKQTLFDLTSMLKMVLIITLIVMLGLLFGAISYLLKMPKIDLPIVTPAFETQCRIDSDCELIYTDYTNHSPCLPCDTSRDYFKCLTQEEIEKMGRRKISDVAVACKPCQNQQHICKCKNGKCEKVKIEAVEEVGITTDKMEYEIGETVEITIKSNTNKEIAICDPFYVIEKFDNGKWIEIKKILCPCGFRCTLVPYFILQLHKPREYNWDQTETWCDDSKKISEMISNQVPTGEYRVKSLLSDAKSAKICLVNSKTIYSNEFTIKEKSALDARCGEKVRFSENCGIAVIGFEFDSGKGKCVKKTGSCKVKTPFNTLEECQEVCEETQPRFDFYSCNQNSDCISVKKDCCGCTAGGSAIAINKKFRDKWHKKFDCGRIMCPAVMSNDLSCFQEPKCAEKSGKCLLRDGVMVD